MPKKKLVIIVDDKPENLFVLKELLYEYVPDIEVQEAIGAEEALKIITPSTDLVISDVQMPEIDGLELCRRIHSAPELSHIPVLLITSHRSTTEFRVAALESGAHDFISRPIDSEELSAKIKKTLELKELQSKLQSEKKKLHKELSLAEKQYKTLFKNATDSIFITDEHLAIIDVNRGCSNLLDYSEEELRGKQLTSFLPITKKYLYQQSGPEENIPVFECSVTTKKGNVVPIEIKFRLVNIGLSKVWWVIVRDVSENKKAEKALLKKEESLKAALAKAEAANKAKSEFLGNMSHELRTPLNGIMGMLQLLLLSMEDTEQIEYATMALKASSRLTNLLSDILDLSMVEAGKLKIVEAPFEISSLLEQVQELFMPKIGPLPIELKIKLDKSVPKSLLGDSSRIIQIMTNLIGNAIKSTSEGCITVDVTSANFDKHQKGRLIVEVTDTGIGIPEDKLCLLFKPFSQLENGYSRESQGAGLGLSICSRIVKLMNGCLCISSKVGEGTVVNFDVQLNSISKPQKTDSAEDLILKNIKTNEKILIAEDDAVSSLFLEKLLSKIGIESRVVTNGQIALEALKTDKFAAVLMDIQMPKMDGLTATKAIRRGESGAENINIPIIALTAHVQEKEINIFTKAGINTFLPKPVNMDQLVKILNSVLTPQKA